MSAPAIAEIFHGRQYRDLTAPLSELQMPVLIVNGAFDKSLRRSKETSAKITGAGHACCLEDPAAVDEAVPGFLERNGLVDRPRIENWPMR